MKEEEKQSGAEPADVLMPIITTMWVQEDVIKIFTGNFAELGHLPAKFYDALKEQRDRFNGSSKRMAKVLAKESILRYINNDNEGHKEKFKPGFDPQQVA